MSEHMENIQAFLSKTIFHVTYGEVGLALAVLVSAFFLRRVLPWLFGLATGRLMPDETEIDTSIIRNATKPLQYIPIVVALYIVLHVLHLRGVPSEVAGRLLKSIVAILTFWTLLRSISAFRKQIYRSSKALPKPVLAWLLHSLQILLVALVVGLVLEIWSIPVAPIIGGLGVFGIAIGLAAKDLFRNLIAGILILVEKRFVPGDWVMVTGIVEGTVEKINFRSTYIRRFDLSPVYVPNASFSDNAVTNYSRMTHRRISWTVGIDYRTSNEQLRQICDQIEAWLINDERISDSEQASLFVCVDKFGENSIDLMIYCFTETTVWAEWLAIKEELALAIKGIILGVGSSFAFPSRSIYIENDASPLDGLTSSRRMSLTETN